MLIGEQERTTAIFCASLFLLYRTISRRQTKQKNKTDAIEAGKAKGNGAWTASTGSGEVDFFLLILEWYTWATVTENALTWLTAACFSWSGMEVQTEFWWRVSWCEQWEWVEHILWHINGPKAQFFPCKTWAGSETGLECCCYTIKRKGGNTGWIWEVTTHTPPYQEQGAWISEPF